MVQVSDSGTNPEDELGDGQHDYPFAVGPESCYHVPLPGLRFGEVQRDNEGHDEAVNGDQHIPPEIDALGSFQI